MEIKRKFNTDFLICLKSGKPVQTEYDFNQAQSYLNSTCVILILKVFRLSGHMSKRRNLRPGRKNVHFWVCVCVCVCVRVCVRVRA